MLSWGHAWQERKEEATGATAMSNRERVRDVSRGGAGHQIIQQGFVGLVRKRKIQSRELYTQVDKIDAWEISNWSEICVNQPDRHLHSSQE